MSTATSSPAYTFIVTALYWLVTSDRTDAITYRVEGECRPGQAFGFAVSCTCPGFPRSKAGCCKHMRRAESGHCGKPRIRVQQRPAPRPALAPTPAPAPVIDPAKLAAPSPDRAGRLGGWSIPDDLMD